MIRIYLCNIPISKIENNCISILRPANKNGVTMKLKRKVEYGQLCTFKLLITLDSYISVPAFVLDRDYVSIRLLLNQRDHFIGQQLQRSVSKINTSCFVLFQKYLFLYDFFNLKVYLITSKIIKIQHSVLNGNKNRSRPASNEMMFLLKVFRS